MADFFLAILNMSLSACWLIAAVLILRPLLRRFSSMLCMAAWALVVIRLLCPFTIESALSLIPSAEPATEALFPSSAYSLPSGFEDYTGDYFVTGTTPDSLQPQVGDSVDPAQVVTAVASVVWLVGIGGMLTYGIVGVIRIRRRTRTAVPLGDGVYEGDDIGTPFIVGVFRPRIYIPSDLGEEERAWVIAHERSHIRWGDAVFKPLGFAALCVHWFNPLVWVCYALFCRDMESACDERVIGNVSDEERRAYSHALLSCSQPRRMILAPLAFGEVDVKERIKNVLSFKRPAVWIAIAACVLLAVAIPLWFCNPPSRDPFFEIDLVLNEQLSDWIYEHHEGAYLEGDVAAENHEILDFIEDDGYTTVYMWVLYQEYDEQNGELVEVSGAHVPTVIVARKTGAEYKLEEYWEAEDGERYAPSIRERFPMRLWGKATDSQRYIEQQQTSCLAIAQWKLQSRNESDAVTLYATVTEIDGTLMTVVPHEGQSVSGKVVVPTIELWLNSNAFAVGDEIVVYYDGTVMETYPLQLGTISRIEKVNNASEPQTQTSSENPSPTLRGTVTQVQTASMTVIPEEGQIVSGDVTVYYSRTAEDGIAVGDTVVIEYDGKINMSYPMQVSAYSVTVE